MKIETQNSLTGTVESITVKIVKTPMHGHLYMSCIVHFVPLFIYSL